MRTALFCCLALLFSPLYSSAQPGSLDSTFANMGIFLATPADSLADFHDALYLNDGRIVTAQSKSGQMAICRFLSTGVLDNSFGNNGCALVDVIPNQFDNAYSLALQPDGKILACGLSESYPVRTDFCLVRLTTDGEPDLTFNASGAVTFALNRYISSSSQDFKVNILPDGRILCLTPVSAPDSIHVNAAFLCYLPDGALDLTFGVNGVAPLYEMNESISATGFAIQPDGKILACGSLHNQNKFFVARFQANGTIDTAFAASGTFSANISQQFFTVCNDVALAPDGGVLACGYYYTNSAKVELWLLKLNENGSPELDFGTGGWVKTPFFIDNSPISIQDGFMAIGPGGTIILGGELLNNTPSWMFADLALIRFLPNGSIDSTFGTNGYVFTETDPPSNTHCNGIALNNSGDKILVFGVQAIIPERYGIMAQYNNTISLNTAELHPEIRFYPLPADEYIQIESTEQLAIQFVELTDQGGRVFSQSISSSGRIDTTKLDNGMYWLLITTRTGKYTQPVIILHR